MKILGKITVDGVDLLKIEAAGCGCKQCYFDERPNFCPRLDCLDTIFTEPRHPIAKLCRIEAFLEDYGKNNEWSGVSGKVITEKIREIIDE
jgi:hypothetical protein